MSIMSELLEIAAEQQGYFTTLQSREIGVSTVELGKLAARGRLERVSYGVYRFPTWPKSAFSEYMEGIMWTRIKGAVLSRESSLYLRGIWEKPSRVIHISIPASCTIHRRVPGKYRIHEENIPDFRMEFVNGVPCVDAYMSLRQIANEANFDSREIQRAIIRADEKGLIPADDVPSLQRLVQSDENYSRITDMEWTGRRYDFKNAS